MKIFLYKPGGGGAGEQKVPLIVHLHGGGWILGGAFGYEKFVFELVERTGCALAFPECTLAPERKFPAQQEQCLEVVQWFVEHGPGIGLDTSKVVVTADSAGGG